MMYVNSPSAFHINRLRLCGVAAAAGLLLAACGGGGGSSSGAPAAVAPAVVVARPVVNLAVTPASVPAGQPVTITWSATDAATCAASGAWSGARGSSGSMVVTPAAAGTFTYNLTCTGSGGSGSGSGAVALGVTGVGAPGNVAQVVVDGGPAGVGRIVNLPYVNVTVCRPGTAVCATVDHVLVDTGSTGLRIFDDAIAALALPPVSGASGNVVGECAQFVSGVLWGSVRTADVKIAGETAASISIQQVADATLTSIPGSCASAGANISTVAALGAKGILGIGLFKQDCGAACAALAIAGTYYECTATTCTSVAMPLAWQVANPVIAFGTNNNGVVLVMPAAPPAARPHSRERLYLASTPRATTNSARLRSTRPTAWAISPPPTKAAPWPRVFWIAARTPCSLLTQRFRCAPCRLGFIALAQRWRCQRSIPRPSTVHRALSVLPSRM